MLYCTILLELNLQLFWILARCHPQVIPDLHFSTITLQLATSPAINGGISIFIRVYASVRNLHFGKRIGFYTIWT
ncbi:MAG: hypothetical protein ACE5KT_05510 [Methanosarcinales archaeon]